MEQNQVLKNAWKRFATYDHNANLLQKDFYRIQIIILIIGIAVSALSLSQTQICQQSLNSLLNQNKSTTIIKENNCNDPSNTNKPSLYGFKTLSIIIIIFPISISILVAASNYFKSGNKWVLLRATAERIKREIFFFRTKTGKYKIDPQLTEGDRQNAREKILTKEIELISNKLMESEVNFSALQKYTGNIGESNDDLQDLTSDKYLSNRLEDQINYYENRTSTLNKQLKILQWAILIAGGVGTFLAAIGLQLWVSLTAILVTSFSTYLLYRQIENSLMKYNQNVTALNSVKAWWYALKENERNEEANVDQLVNTTETILETELAAWIHNMQNALVKLREQQESKGKT